MNVSRFLKYLCTSLCFLCIFSGCTSHDRHTRDLFPNSKLSLYQVENWAEDLDYLVDNLEQKHIRLYHATDRAQFRADIEQLKLQLPIMNQSELKVALMALVNNIGDGHTMSGWWGNSFWRFPLSFKWFGSDLRLIATSNEHAVVLGYKLRAINGVAVTEIVDKLKKLAPTAAENIHASKDAVSWTVNVADVLLGLKIIQNYEFSNFTFEDDKGKQVTLKISSVRDIAYKKSLSALLTKPKNRFGKVVESTSGIDLYVDEVNAIAYIDFDHYPDYWDMFWFGPNVIEQLEDNNIKNVIIDLRDNGGGNFFIGLFLAQELVVVDNINWQSGVYVLINNATFSAASSNAVQFRQILNAQIVGEPSGGNPYGYQDSDSFILPNSGWPISYSKRLFRLQDSPTEGVRPDVFIELNWNEYKRGTDTQVQWIINQIKK
jgi:hypothetical protein